MKILCVGPTWRGSNAGGLFKAFLRLGHQVQIVDEYYHIPLDAKSLKAKIISRLSRNTFIGEFNDRIRDAFIAFQPDLVLIYKGAFVRPETVTDVKKTGTPIINFFPDVSMFAHGKLLPQTMNLYDFVFTTKTFGLTDLREKFGYTTAAFIPHGFDPDIHRPIKSADNPFVCDVSFIGTWSPKKEAVISELVNSRYSLKVWGNQWEKTTTEAIRPTLENKELLGDLYVMAISGTAVNLGILSEARIGSSNGDQITSRTFHIPAAGGFMLHERTDEVQQCFEESEEMACYGDTDELREKIKYYIEHPDERRRIAERGYERALRDHSLDARAKEVLSILRREGLTT